MIGIFKQWNEKKNDRGKKKKNKRQKYKSIGFRQLADFLK